MIAIAQSLQDHHAELLALRQFVTDCAMLLECGGGTVIMRIEMELQWREEDAEIKKALHSRIARAQAMTQEVIGDVEHRDRPCDREMLTKLMAIEKVLHETAEQVR